MDDRFEMMLEDVFLSEGFFPDDDLTLMIQQETDSEIEVDDLDYVAAARKNDFQSFMKKINE